MQVTSLARPIVHAKQKTLYYSQEHGEKDRYVTKIYTYYLNETANNTSRNTFFPVESLGIHFIIAYPKLTSSLPAGMRVTTIIRSLC
jgi:hypothetical protein